MPSSQSPHTNGASEANGATSVHDLLYGDETPRRSSQLHDLIETLWSGKWIILGVLVLVVGAAAIYTYSLPTTYRTSSLLLVDRSSQSSVLSGLGRGRSSPFMRQDQTLQNELLILRQSRTIANRVAERLQEMETHPQTGAPLQILRGPEGQSRSTAAVAGTVQGIVSAQPSGEQTDALYIAATSNHAYEAGLVANLYAEEYIARTQERSRESLQASREFLEQQARTLETDLEAAEAKVEDFMQTHEAVSLDQASSQVVGQISELEARRSELQIELDMKRSALEDLETELADAEPKLAERLSSGLNERLQRVQQEKAELVARIDAVERRNPGLNGGGTRARDLRQLRRRVDRLQQRADSLARAYVDQSLEAGAAGGEEGSTAGVGPWRRSGSGGRSSASTSAAWRPGSASWSGAWPSSGRGCSRSPSSRWSWPSCSASAARRSRSTASCARSCRKPSWPSSPRWATRRSSARRAPAARWAPTRAKTSCWPSCWASCWAAGSWCCVSSSTRGSTSPPTSATTATRWSGRCPR
jgi:uncharacterized protein involved in exopolysaccharide biosynthesis